MCWEIGHNPAHLLYSVSQSVRLSVDFHYRRHNVGTSCRAAPFIVVVEHSILGGIGETCPTRYE